MTALSEKTPPRLWPKAAALFLGLSFIAMLLWYLLTPLTHPSKEDRTLYQSALASYAAAEEDLGLAASRAVLALRQAEENPGVAIPGLNDLHNLLQVEPPHYEPRPIEMLTREELVNEVKQANEASAELADLTRRLSQQASKIEKALGGSR